MKGNTLVITLATLIIILGGGLFYLHSAESQERPPEQMPPVVGEEAEEPAASSSEAEEVAEDKTQQPDPENEPREEEVDSEPEIVIENEVAPEVATYIEVIDSCGPYFGGSCLRARAAATTTSAVQDSLRRGQVLKVVDTETDSTGRLWYHVTFDEWLRYPERHGGDWYVAGEFVKALGTPPPTREATTTNKRIVVDLGDQTLTAFNEDDSVFMEQAVSTGITEAPTPRGNFSIFYKTPSRYMQGPIPDITTEFYDLPAVPWNLYFTQQGAVVHGAYWHDKFGQTHSHGCVNLPPEQAEKLYPWAEVGTELLVRD